MISENEISRPFSLFRDWWNIVEISVFVHDETVNLHRNTMIRIPLFDGGTGIITRASPSVFLIETFP